MRQCTLRIIDEVNCAFLGLTDDHANMLVNKFALYAEGYFFNPRFKLGMWDGKVKYFTPAGKTYNYLIDQILPIIKNCGYAIKLEDKRISKVVFPDNIDCNIFNHINHPKTGKPIILRDDQVNAVNTLLQEGNGICLAATSAGKSIIISALIQAYAPFNIRTITIVPDQTLIRQLKADFTMFGFDPGEYSGKEKTPEKQHVVSTWQALQNNPTIVSGFDMVIVDETHKCKAKVLQELLVKYAAKIPHRFGFTGTLPKDPNNERLVYITMGPVRITITASELMDIGAIAQLKINVIQLEEDMKQEYKNYVDNEHSFGPPPTYKQYKDQYFPDFSAEKDYLQRNKTRIQWIADFLIKQRDSTGNVMCLVGSIAFGRKLAKLIPGAIFVNGTDMKKVDDRTDTYDLFDTRDDLIVIATVHVAGTGLSINRIMSMVFVDIGKAFERTMQAIGRGLRLSHDKTSIIVSDICSDLKYSRDHMKFRVDYYKEAKYKFEKHKIDYLKTT